LRIKNLTRLIGFAILIAVPVSASAVIGSPSPKARAPLAASAPRLTETVQRPFHKPLEQPRYNPVRDARAFVALINEIRRAHHLKPLRLRGDLTSIAARWSARMAAIQKISHNKKFRYQISGWWLLGENVGWTNASVEYLHRAFLASPEHRRNILDPRFTAIGVGETVSKDGRIFVTEDFGRFTPCSTC
jgi:uncharacterized protein YkwD